MRYLLLPISGIYYVIIFIRNLLFDRQFIRSKKISKSIGIGNLSMGGTGKSPLSIYLSEFLIQNNTTPALLSRGYGRESTGFIEVQENSSSQSVGDEPLMFKQRFENRAHVFVCADRVFGSEKIRRDHPECAIIYDDVFQHRKITPTLSILTTPFDDLFIEDKILPVGRLREPIKNAKRTDIIMVTKSPEELSQAKLLEIQNGMGRFGKPIFFSSISYEKMVPFDKKINTIKNVLLVTGIANPEHLLNHLKNNFLVHSISFRDHHVFTASDINKIHEKFDTFELEESIILTTEKDKVRLSKFKTLICEGNYPWYYQPMNIRIREESDFQSLIKKHVRGI